MARIPSLLLSSLDCVYVFPLGSNYLKMTDYKVLPFLFVVATR